MENYKYAELIGTWQINTSIVAKFLDERVNLGVCMLHLIMIKKII
jgi:hypothetical protein